MTVALMVAEKPSLAESLAKLLCNGQIYSRKGLNGACSVHEWQGKFENSPVKFKMTSVCGHVLTSDFPAEFNNWDKVDPARGASILILWLDCDKEGENICFEVIDAVIPITGQNLRIYRAHFSAVTASEINNAMRTLRAPNKNESESVDARQELDLRIGCAFTRFQTKFFQNKYGSRMISYGPCQTPTLGFCVKRRDAIQAFKPENFWRIKARIMAESEEVPLKWERDRVFDRDVAQTILNAIKSQKVARITNVTTKAQHIGRPLGLNTVEMLRVASSGLGIGPHNCMQIAERLYTSGYINYPRTETTSYPSSMDLKGLLHSQKSHPFWGKVASDILDHGIVQPRKGVDVGDHPPIAPMKMVPPSALSHDAARLYEYICRHFMATLMSDCMYNHVTTTFKIGEEVFTATGDELLDPGFTTAMPWLEKTDSELPHCLKQKGDTFPLSSNLELEAGKTGPPDYLTESELITAMEKHGIGTDASIPVHIENIVERGYVEMVCNPDGSHFDMP